MADHLRLTRELYNACIEERSLAYKKAGVSISRFEQSRSLPAVKEVRPEYKQIYANTLVEVVIQVDRAFQAFFQGVKQGRKVGYPKFKGRRFWTSFRYTMVQNGETLKWYGPGKFTARQRIYLPYIGNVKIRRHTDLPGRAAVLTIQQRPDGWYAIYTCQIAQPEALPATDKQVGVDLGLKTFVVTDQGDELDLPHVFRETQQRLARMQRAVSRKKRGSKNRREAQRQVARLHQRMADTRLNHHRRIANLLIAGHDLIVHENLNIKGLARGMLRKHVLDVAWGQFLNILAYKGERFGRAVIAVNPAGTTQACSGCGVVVPKKLNERLHTCPECGTTLDRDVNAARNVLALGLGKLPTAAD